MKNRRLRQGTTLVETLTAATMTVLCLTAAVAVMLSGLRSWARGEGHIMAETDSQKAVRIISQKLREAWQVTIDANGQGLTYILPQKDVDGNYVTPPVADGVTRRIELDGTTLNIVTNGVPRTLCKGIILTDPLSSGGTGSYRIFTSPAGATTRQITIEIVTQRNAFRSANVTSRTRETIFLRNVPELTR